MLAGTSKDTSHLPVPFDDLVSPGVVVELYAQTLVAHASPDHDLTDMNVQPDRRGPVPVYDDDRTIIG